MVRLHGIVLKARAVTLFVFIASVYCILCAVILRIPYQLGDITMLSKIATLEYSVTYFYIMSLITLAVFAVLAVCCAYAAALYGAAKSVWHSKSVILILLDAFINFVLFTQSLNFDRQTYVSEIPLINTAIFAVLTALTVYSVVALLSDLLWLIVNRKAKKREIAVPANVRLESVFGVAAPAMMTFGAVSAFIPAFVLVAVMLANLKEGTSLDIEYYLNALIAGAVLSGIQILTAAATVLSRKKKICYVFAVVNVLTALGVIAAFMAVISSMVSCNLMIYIGEAAMIVASFKIISEHKEFERMKNAPPPAHTDNRYPEDDEDVDIIGGRRVLNSRSYAVPDGRRVERDFDRYR